jgi:CRISPR/Cas system-associated endonuclease Cas1
VCALRDQVRISSDPPRRLTMEELIEATTERARLNMISAKAAAERIEQELARMSRERLLPDEKTLEKVARYEAHLSRLLHKALHELEAMQTRRSGAVAPLARLDVDGLP